VTTMELRAVSGCNAAAVNRAPGEVFDATPEDAAALVARGQAVQSGPCPKVASTAKVQIGDQAVVVEVGGRLLHPGVHELDGGTVKKLWGRLNVLVLPDGGDL
jgi:hypothetical protein